MRSSRPLPRFLIILLLGPAASCFPGGAALAQAAGYEFDPAFNGNYAIDAFTTGETTGAERYGSKIVRLPGGDVVTAGLVRLDNDPVAAPNWNIGLVRHSPSGTRQVWSGSGPYFHAGNQYVVYPNLAAGATGINTIRTLIDFAYARGFFYLLVRTRFSDTPIDHDVQLLIFREDGGYVNAINVLNGSADENGIALSVIETGQVANPVAIAILGVVSGFRSAIAKYLVNASNVIQLDASFGGGDGRVEFVLPLDECSYPGCDYFSTDIAFPVGGGGGSNKPIYVSGSVQRDSATSTDYDMVAIKFTPAGLLDTAFDFNGIRQYAFDQQDSNKTDFASDLIVRRSPVGNFDTVWMMGPVGRRCSQGIGVVKFDGASGAPVSTFGSAGRAVFGDDVSQPGGPCDPEAALDPAGLVAQDGEIGIAATGFLLDENGARVFETGVLLRLSADTGQRYSIAGFRLFTGDKYYPNTLGGIATGEGGGRYYVSGAGRTGNYNSLFLAARLKPVDDLLFRNGFDP
jgi:hypothetical protein